ncbi:dihydropteroate synthase [Pseudoalteromonas ruthenica]|uniref:Dihydropteroate synthase n=1 Tax=Pseudoalteromonas ruthenica TaxID=151081 RepID=A0A0F4PZG2_9GAMM|nr:dihydropteroate synthase [Pseudoalteromonas ruthenica]KJZ00808.1 dihydropteroate synthase [Pseudoalteromonas ruthenica]KJZ01139.1 dihydropteroate synthase [Pseudoalteromonas ruthenica]TMO85696.1 dihydropteroate synthase [Pseudoalteromonas ruthenica]TMO92465.1 dihydropteroate synthase [Pseudoalteromonas ruthenica]TMO98935.1 dihydropteroate synthase [Pseudoalteromonas ruthenica]
MTRLTLPRDRYLDLSTPQVMGILNVTPDSFSDGGQHNSLDNAVNRALTMLEQGATIIDVGGESTRPGADDVAEQEELQRVVPVIKAIRERSDCVISIDTSKAGVMTAAVQAGADIINDVRALQEPGALSAAASAQVPVCIMHMRGQPRSMQNAPDYHDVTKEVGTFLQERARQCIEAGISKTNIIIDPGFGFGKSLQHNYQLLSELEQLQRLGYPVLTGLSRKSMFGKLLNRDADQRLSASLAGALICMQKGARIVRVHDVQETTDIVKVFQATQAPLQVQD